MEFAGGEIARLPEECVSAAISFTTPHDACRSAAVSAAFRSAADSDAVWSRFIPRDLPPLAPGELSPPPESKKELFFRLCDHPVLLADGRMSLGLERGSGAKCYMLSARALYIVWSEVPEYWRWIPLADSRFSEGAELLDVCWLEIRGKIQSKMLSPNTTYNAYFVFKIADDFYGLDIPPQETSVSVGGSESNRKVCLLPLEREEDGDDERQQHNVRHRIMPFWYQCNRRGGTARAPATGGHRETVLCPHARNDGWMEVEMGDFYNEEGDNGEVRISLIEIKGGQWKRGLIVQGIEIRPKK